MVKELTLVHGADRGKPRTEGQGARWRLDVLRLDQERVLRGWTRAELARQAHVDPGTLSDMVNGRRRSTFASVQAVCTVLGLGLRDVPVFGDRVAERRVA